MYSFVEYQMTDEDVRLCNLIKNYIKEIKNLERDYGKKRIKESDEKSAIEIKRFKSI